MEVSGSSSSHSSPLPQSAHGGELQIGHDVGVSGSVSCWGSQKGVVAESLHRHVLFALILGYGAGRVFRGVYGNRWRLRELRIAEITLHDHTNRIR